MKGASGLMATHGETSAASDRDLFGLPPLGGLRMLPLSMCPCPCPCPWPSGACPCPCPCPNAHYPCPCPCS
eukprot:1345541-Prymnesium_polylepis.1